MGAKELPLLMHFAFSHFNEKVRWALAHKGVAHRRQALLPGLHVPAVWRLTRRTQVPVLIDQGRVIPDSTAIIAHLEAQHPEAPALYPADPAARARALELEEVWDREIGPHLRRLAYHLALDDDAFMHELVRHDASPRARLAFRAILPGLRPLMRRTMKINATTAASSEARLIKALDRMAQELGPSGYQVGEGFTVADLTAAALLSPALRAEQLEYPYPARLPAGLDAFCARVCAHPAGQYALEMYRRHYAPSTAVR